MRNIIINTNKDTIKTLINLALLVVLAFTAYSLVTPSGRELIECRTFAPGLQIVKNCAANNSRVTCISNAYYINNTGVLNWT